MAKVFEENIPKTIVLIGMMGVGKTSIGRRLAKRLGVGFTDSDHEVELAAKCLISDIFDIYGEEVFRDVQHRVIKRLLNEPVHVLATGGSAFADPETQKVIKENGISVWLKAPTDTILPRIERRNHRPQFTEGDIQETLERLMKHYSPYYEKADIHIDCSKSTPDATTEKLLLELNKHISKQQMKKGQRIHHV